jgi:membrane fusion protein, multidrug efflux system
MRIAVESNAFLEKRNAASRQDVEIAKARASKAAAEADALRIRLDQCSIIAPFDGRVSELVINEHEMSVAGKPMLSIIEEGDLEIDLILPSDWLVWLKAGADFAFAIDETQQVHPASIVRIGATVDSISQTIKVTGRFTASRAGVLPGMSGSARFAVPGG